MKPNKKREVVIAAIEDFWKKAFDSVHVSPADPSRFLRLRPSSYPYCGLRDVYGRMLEGIPKTREMDLNGVLYTSIGTRVHYLLQENVGRFKSEFGIKHDVKILGDWKCSKKYCKGKRKFCEYKKCPICNSMMNYEEIEIEFGPGKILVGHIDKVIRVGNMLIILDYKTTSVKAINRHYYQKDYFPYKANVSQIMCYTALLKKAFAHLFKPGKKFAGCEVVGAILAYVARDAPGYQKAFVWVNATENDKEIAYKQTKKNIRHFQHVLAATDRESIQVLIDQKPCPSRQWYDKEMHNFELCPLASKNACFKPASLEAKLVPAVKANLKRLRKSRE